MHIAVARVHMKRHEHAAVQDFLVQGVDTREQVHEQASGKNLVQRFAELLFHEAFFVALQRRKVVVKAHEVVGPGFFHARQQFQCLLPACADQFSREIFFRRPHPAAAGR